jgi:hypothetical protein
METPKSMNLAALRSRFAGSVSDIARTAVRSILALMLAMLAALPVAAAQGIGVRNVEIAQVDDGWQLDAQFDLQLSPRIEEAVNRGVPLFFVIDFEISRPRWYWFDEKPIQQSQMYKISYTPLLRQYRLSVGNNYQNFTRFEEVARVLSRLRGWHIADKGALKKDQVYQAALRMRLDTAQLPKPLQLSAIASSEWTLESDWHRWSITP